MYIGQDYLEIPQAIAYQCDPSGGIIGNSRLPGFLTFSNSIVQFNIGSYNPSEYLILELAYPSTPTGPNFSNNLGWATYYGGNSADIPSDVETDTENNIYVVGETSSPNFPHTVSLVTSPFGVYSGFLIKFDNSTYRKWATFFGGNRSDFGYKLAVTDSHVITAGTSRSTNAPILNSGTGYYATANNLIGEGDIHILKIDTSNGGVVHGTFLGNPGILVDNILGDIKYDENHQSIYMVEKEGIPIWGNNNSSVGSGFIAKFDGDLNPIWSTMIGGNANEFEVLAIAIKDNEGIIVGGYCSNNGITPQNHINNTNSYLNNYLGDPVDGYLMMFSPRSNNVLWATYLGGNSKDEIEDIELGASGDIYVAGNTRSDNLYTYSNNILLADSLKGYKDGFITRFDSIGNLKYSSYLGGINGRITEMVIDDLENVYYTGTASGGLNVLQYPPNYYTEHKKPNYSDAFILTMNTINLPDWTTYFGGNSTDVGLGITISSNDYLYITGNTGSTASFPWMDPLPSNSNNWFDNTPSSIGDAFVAKFLLSHLVSMNQMNAVSKNNILVYPTVSSTGLYKVKTKNKNKLIYNRILVFNGLGQIVYSKKINHSLSTFETILNLSHLSSGTYYVSLAGESVINTQPIILSK